jgi:hypothetical protein
MLLPDHRRGEKTATAGYDDSRLVRHGDCSILLLQSFQTYPVTFLRVFHRSIRAGLVLRSRMNAVRRASKGFPPKQYFKLSPGRSEGEEQYLWLIRMTNHKKL